MKFRSAMTFFLILQLTPLQAAEIYRWVDENGRTQISDIAPEKYKKPSTRVDSRQYELTAAQRNEAESRAEREKARLSTAMERKAQAAPLVPAKAAAAAQNNGSPADASDCAAQHRLYRESQECFAPYKIANGSVQVEAYEKCKAVMEPSHQCGHAKPD